MMIARDSSVALMRYETYLKTENPRILEIGRNRITGIKYHLITFIVDPQNRRNVSVFYDRETESLYCLALFSGIEL